MGRAIIMHVDDAPWIRGTPAKPGQPLPRASQFIGDTEKGPWINVNCVPANTVINPHSHTQDEIIHVIEGDLTVGKRRCGPGTILFIEKDTEYGFTTGPAGVRFVNIRPKGRADIKWTGEPS